MGWKNFKNALERIFRSCIFCCKKKSSTKENEAPGQIVEAQGNIKISQAPIQNLDECKLIGKGAFGKVYKVQLADGDQEAAVKVINVKRDDEIKEKTLQEINILRRLNHKNIVRCYDACLETIENSEEGRLWIMMEYCNGGSLNDLINNHHKLYYKFLPEDWIRYITKEILKGLSYLHKARIAHKDIKADNILLTEDGEVKIADFGLAVQLSGIGDKITNGAGTRCFIAPEIYEYLLDDNNGYNMACDIWALGITILEMAEGNIPYNQLSSNHTVCMTLMLDPPTLHPLLWSKKCQTFLKRCLEKDPEKRGTAKGLLKHNFIQGLKSTESAQMKISRLLKALNVIEGSESEAKSDPEDNEEEESKEKVKSKDEIKIANEDADKDDEFLEKLSVPEVDMLQMTKKRTDDEEEKKEDEEYKKDDEEKSKDKEGKVRSKDATKITNDDGDKDDEFLEKLSVPEVDMLQMMKKRTDDEEEKKDEYKKDDKEEKSKYKEGKVNSKDTTKVTNDDGDKDDDFLERLFALELEVDKLLTMLSL